MHLFAYRETQLDIKNSNVIIESVHHKHERLESLQIESPQ